VLNVRCGQKTAATPNVTAKNPFTARPSAIEDMSDLLIHSPFIVTNTCYTAIQKECQLSYPQNNFFKQHFVLISCEERQLYLIN
jgi:hypothetical protein